MSTMSKNTGMKLFTHMQVHAEYMVLVKLGYTALMKDTDNLNTFQSPEL